MIYFDNAATSYPKPRCVINELENCLKNYCGNPGRSSNILSYKASEAIYSTREKIANLLGVDTPECIVFTYNATYALNMAIKSFVDKDCHVITSDFEHNSVIRPLEKLKKTLGLSYSMFDTKGNLEENILSIIKPDTKGIICSIASNVTGEAIDLGVLSKIAKKKNLFLIIDASQAIGHTEINLSKTPCDALCAPGHKALFGIQGSGFVYFKDKVRKETLIEGGSGAESASPYMPLLLPEGYEAGTLSTPAIAALGSGIDFINKVSIDEISYKLEKMTADALERLNNFDNVKVYGGNSGIVSFNVDDIPSIQISSLLDQNGIFTRGGLHCAPSAHRRLSTLSQGTVRISFSYFNKPKEIDKFYRTLRCIIKKA